MRGNDLVGRPVVDLSNGEDVAEVRDVVFDPTSGLLTGFTLNERGAWTGRLQAVLPIDRVSSIGTGAVVIARIEALGDVPASDDVVHAAADAHAEVVDDLVVTESGRTLGTVKDVVIAGGPSPRVVAFEIGGGDIGGGFIPMSPSGAVSASTLIVPDGYADRLRSDLAGLSEELVQLHEGDS